MNCGEVQKRLPEILDAEGVPARIREQMQAHISGCRCCSDQWSLLNKSWKMLGAYPVPPLAPDFVDAVMRQIARGSAAPQRRRRARALSGALAKYRVSLLCAAAAAALALLIGFFVVHDGARKVSPDIAIVENLDFYLKLELLENIELLSDYEVVKTLE
jgi:hypothetical protein